MLTGLRRCQAAGCCDLSAVENPDSVTQHEDELLFDDFKLGHFPARLYPQDIPSARVG